MKMELAADAGAILGEGPWWDASASVLYWLDIQGRRLHTFDPSLGKDRAVALAMRPGAVVGRARGGLLMAMEDGFAFADPLSGSRRTIVDPEAELPGNRFNDGKCDPLGRFWAGTMDDAEQAFSGSLYRLDPDLSWKRIIEGVGISNGLAWSPDGRTMYYIDTRARRVDAFDYDLDEGSISGRRIAFEVPASMGSPDGMTIDEEGMLWVALWEGWGLGRWDPRTGRLLERVRIPVARTTSCCFGGERLDRLFVTTARTGLDSEGLIFQPQAGGLFTLECGVRGQSSIPFAG